MRVELDEKELEEQAKNYMSNYSYTVSNSSGDEYNVDINTSADNYHNGWVTTTGQPNTIVWPQTSDNSDWQTWSSGETTYTPIVDADEAMRNKIAIEQGMGTDILGTIFVKDGKIYMRNPGGKTILLGEAGEDKVGKKISIAVTKKKLKETVRP